MSADEDVQKKSTTSNDEEGATMMWDGANRPSKDTVQEGIHIRMYGQTDVGLVREHNEDNFLIADISENIRGGIKGLDDKLLNHKVGKRGTIFAVCDGMGGAAAGEVASQMAVDTVHEIMSANGPPKDRDDFARRLVKSIEEAGARIFASAKVDRTRRGMGTTSTVAGLIDKVLFVGQIGDSRAYVLRGSDFNQVTKDQSLVNQLIEAGQLTEEEAESFEHQNIILQALGTADSVQVDLTFLELRRGDRVMLCSDGLSGLVHPLMIKDVMSAVKDQRACCATLIEMARTGGGHDNITVIVADFDGDGLGDPKESTQKVAYQQYPLPHSDETRRTTPPSGDRPGGLPFSPPEDETGLKRADSVFDTVGSRRRRRKTPLIAGILLLVLGIAGGVLAWKRGVFGGPAGEEQPPNSSVSPSAAPDDGHESANANDPALNSQADAAVTADASLNIEVGEAVEFGEAQTDTVAAPAPAPSGGSEPAPL